MSEVTHVMEAAEPQLGDPVDALRRVLEATWRTLGRFHALVAINTRRLPPTELQRRHHRVLALLEPLIQRGQRDGAFRADVPASWHLSMILALVHAAIAEHQAGRIPADQVESAVVPTVLGALAAPPTS
jgi:hypothetical protein